MLTAVVPCYDEEETLAAMHERLSAACYGASGDSHEIVLIDDGSKDGTWPLMLELAAKDPHVVLVRLTRNHGHQLALSAGLEVATGDRILIIDADLQDPPELLPGMMRLMDEGADVVYGRRTARKGESAFKRMSAAVFYRTLRRLVDVDIPLDTGDFRLMSRKALDLLRQMPEQHRFIRGMVSWVGFTQVPLDYERDERFAGETKYPLGKMLSLGVDAVTGFSTKPLRIATYLGFIFAVLAMLGFAYTLYGWFYLKTVAGWPSVMTAVLVLGSLQLLVLGVMGEYVGRTFLEAKRRPIFLIDQIVRGGAVSLPEEVAREAARGHE